MFYLLFKYILALIKKVNFNSENCVKSYIYHIILILRDTRVTLGELPSAMVQVLLVGPLKKTFNRIFTEFSVMKCMSAILSKVTFW